MQEALEQLAGEAHAGGVIARGAGRSYGDAAQNGGGVVLDTSALDTIVSIDRERRTVSAHAGVTIARLLARLAEQDLTLPVVPGTRHVTLAGAIASDIHGKNHHRDGGFARYVTAMSLWTPARGVVALSADGDPDLFYATLGGMGLTGIVLEATLRVEPLTSSFVAVDTDRTSGLEQTLEVLAAVERRRYSVAWLDMLAPGAAMGRAVITRADPLERNVGHRADAGHAAAGDGARLAGRARRSRQRGGPQALERDALLHVPRATPAWLLRPASVRLFNAARWKASPRRERARPVALGPYFFPLDAIGEWSRLYGRSGLIQYQLVIPVGAEQQLRRCFEVIRARRVPVYLAVFKRFGVAFGGPLSFPLEGWTLAADIPAAAPGLEPALRELDEIVAACGGRVYLSKDARLSREMLHAMYPRLDRFRAQQERVDPHGVMRSDLARRLGLWRGEG
jgi:decaprenylphospho-beta-D-ribofuranose 2-oxidase